MLKRKEQEPLNLTSLIHYNYLGSIKENDVLNSIEMKTN